MTTWIVDNFLFFLLVEGHLLCAHLTLHEVFLISNICWGKIVEKLSSLPKASVKLLKTITPKLFALIGLFEVCTLITTGSSNRKTFLNVFNIINFEVNYRGYRITTAIYPRRGNMSNYDYIKMIYVVKLPSFLFQCYTYSWEFDGNSTV